MGFDITFHPYSQDEMNHFFFEVMADPSLAPERASEISKNTNKAADIQKIYHAALEIWPAVKQGKEQFSTSGGYLFAAIAGFLHPYWYTRGLFIGWLQREIDSFPQLLTPLTEDVPLKYGESNDEYQCLIELNYQAGGFVRHNRLVELEEALLKKETDALVQEWCDPEDMKSIINAIQYCRKNELNMLEVSDIAVPFTGGCNTDIENLRAVFSNNHTDCSNSRYG